MLVLSLPKLSRVENCCCCCFFFFFCNGTEYYSREFWKFKWLQHLFVYLENNISGGTLTRGRYTCHNTCKWIHSMNWSTTIVQFRFKEKSKIKCSCLSTVGIFQSFYIVILKFMEQNKNFIIILSFLVLLASVFCSLLSNQLQRQVICSSVRYNFTMKNYNCSLSVESSFCLSNFTISK